MRHRSHWKALLILCVILLSGSAAPSLWSSTLHKRLPKRALPQSTSPTVGQSATLLPSGQTLLLGGEDSGVAVSTAALKNPQTGVVTNLKHGLLHARIGHTATLLPDGMVLIFGGMDGSGHVVTIAEQFDPRALTFSIVPSIELTVRAFHSANLLTDGRLVVAGGVSATGETLGLIEIWDYRTKGSTKLPQGVN